MAEFIDWEVSESDREILRPGKNSQQEMDDLGRAVIDAIVFFAVITLWVSLRLYNKRAEELKTQQAQQRRMLRQAVASLRAASGDDADAGGAGGAGGAAGGLPCAGSFETLPRV